MVIIIIIVEKLAAGDIQKPVVSKILNTLNTMNFINKIILPMLIILVIIVIIIMESSSGSGMHLHAYVYYTRGVKEKKNLACLIFRTFKKKKKL